MMMEDFRDFREEIPELPPFDQIIAAKNTTFQRFTDFVPQNLQLEFKTVSSKDKLILLSWLLNSSNSTIINQNEPFWKGVLHLLQNSAVTVNFGKIRVNSTAMPIPELEPVFTIEMPDSVLGIKKHRVYFYGSVADNLSCAEARTIESDPQGGGSIRPNLVTKKFDRQFSFHIGTQTVPGPEGEEGVEVGFCAIHTMKSATDLQPTQKGFRTNGTPYP